ncbi:hypothetical protein [Umezawaea sp. Da 62-37]|uniref:hypothetical protein n=1 Tax=Umezawaea sp. Da 62-37 TaxID=3075927 RepID=UPI0028F6E841|nr:hypothetical protein [Umezawaea sp. Da 62-37]WNV87665.1 hypothetical protein RM788_05050 [Umezawaea sp. Da 62-37]
MGEVTRSGGRASTLRQSVVGRLWGTAVVVGLVAVAGAGYLDATQEVRVPHGVHLVAVSGLGELSDPRSVVVPDCCSEEGPSAVPGETARD